LVRRLDITGDTYGRLTVIQYSHQDSHKKSQWWVQCECGICLITSGAAMRKGNTLSCGCLGKEQRVRSTRKHGGCGKGTEYYHPNYTSWISMIQRCKRASHKNYHYYGGRGIRVCDRWVDDETGLAAFTEDMGDRPSKSHSIDRIDVNGDYAPDNCRWATKKEQAYNQRKRKNNSTGRTGVYPEKTKGLFWVGISKGGKFQRIKGGLSYKDACDLREAEEIKEYGYSKE